MNELLDLIFYAFLIITPFMSGLYFEKHFVIALGILEVYLVLYLIKIIISRYKAKKYLKEKNDKEEKIKNKNEIVHEKIIQDNVRSDNKLLRKIILYSFILLLITNTTYLFNSLIYHIDVLDEFITYGNVQLLEMILLVTIVVLRYKDQRIKDDIKKNNTDSNESFVLKETSMQNNAIIITSIAMALLMFIPSYYREGRFEATFYYANSTAMFFLISLIVLINQKAKNSFNRIAKYIVALLLLVAIVLTNSRIVYVLSIMYFMYEALKIVIKKINDKNDNKINDKNITTKKENKKIKEQNIKNNKKKKIIITSGIILGIILVIGSFVLLLNNEKIKNRFNTDIILRDFKLRFSYLEEANEIIKDYPLGLGYEGYLNHQEIKENKYKLRLVHNMPYQIVLNYGIQTLILTIILFARYMFISFKNKKLFSYENIILYLFILHTLMDIDNSFLALDNYILMLAVRNIFDDRINYPLI